MLPAVKVHYRKFSGQVNNNLGNNPMENARKSRGKRDMTPHSYCGCHVVAPRFAPVSPLFAGPARPRNVQ
jgi:hypothetical protein